MLWMATIQLSLAVFCDILCIYFAGFFSYQYSHGPFQTQFQFFFWFVSFLSLGRLAVERSQELVVMFQVDVDDDETLFILWCFHSESSRTFLSERWNVRSFSSCLWLEFTSSLLAAVGLYYITIGLYLSSFLMLIFLARYLWSAATGRLSRREKFVYPVSGYVTFSNSLIRISRSENVSNSSPHYKVVAIMVGSTHSSYCRDNEPFVTDRQHNT